MTVLALERVVVMADRTMDQDARVEGVIDPVIS
jgi:hypothetical protein